MTFPAQLLSYYTSRQGPTTAYSAPGTYSEIVPEGVTVVSAVCIGGGGGGAGGSGSNASGSGGGGGGGLSWGIFSVTPGETLTIEVGQGGTAGAYNGSGGNGGSSRLRRNITGTTSALADITILEASGGQGGTRLTTGSGGAGGIGNSADASVYVKGGGNGGAGGSANSGTTGAGGGGGAAGYRGNGGTGGNATTAPTAAATNSGGGGGGGGSNGSGSASATGYGGGGVGAYGYVGIGQGAAGTNDTGSGGTGGDGGSFFNDPGALGVYPEQITDFVSTGSTLGITTTRPVLENDFLLLLSGSDKDSGILELPVPTGFTTFSKSVNGVYTVATGSAATAVIPSNVTVANATRDLNFASSYKYVTASDLDSNGFYSGTLTGLASTAIHNLIVLRKVPNPANLKYATSSGDPAINSTSGNFIGTFPASAMPDPPSIPNVPDGAISIALGFLSNTLISPNASNIAGNDSTTIGSLNAGVPPDGTAVMAAYLTAGGGPAGSTVNPSQMKTGTASHARAYTIEIRRANSGTGITTVGYAGTGSYTDGVNVIQPSTTFNLPPSIQAGDLIIYVGSSDTRKGKTDSTSKGGKAIANPNFGSGGSAFTTVDFSGPGQGSPSNDTRGGGSLSFRIAYRVLQSGDGLTVNGLTTETDPILAQTAAIAHSFIILRNAFQYSVGGNAAITNYSVWDNGSQTDYPLNWTGAYGPPDPPALTTTQADSVILQIGFLDNVTISNVTNITPPNNYISLQNESYGEQNNGAIIMSSIRVGLTSAASEDPTEYIGAGANIWVSQTILIGGTGGETAGTNLGAGRYGGGGGSRLNTATDGNGVAGASGAVRLIYGTGRQYPSANQGNVIETW